MHADRAGRVYALKSSTQDAYDPSGVFVAYSKASGGIFMDCGIHDIDMSRWLLSTDQVGRAEVKRVLASGLITAHPELEAQGDCDNAFGIIEYTNGTTCTLHLSRTGMGGYDSLVEAYGMGQKVTVGTPAQSALQIADGSRRVEGKPTYLARFADAFVREVQAFVDVCLDGKRESTEGQTDASRANHAVRCARGRADRQGPHRRVPHRQARGLRRERRADPLGSVSPLHGWLETDEDMASALRDSAP
jgi:myo-inositol 2-dehydrogenase/D-chiro-inositol 1-dehydrogenase